MALEKSTGYTTKSLYNCLTHGGVRDKVHDILWKCKIPIKVKVFLWQAIHNKLQTLVDLGPVWHGSNSGWSCSTPELQVEPVLVGVGALGGASSRWSRSCKRGAPKLHLHLHYSSMELAAPWSFGVGVFGWKIGWSCWSSAPEPCQTPPYYANS